MSHNPVQGRKSVKMSDSERLKNFFDRCSLTPSGCWEYNGPISNSGYPRFTALIDGKKKSISIHRWVLEKFVGKINHALHNCDNTRCINPLHLFNGTHKDNMNDMRAKGRGIPQQTHCKRGHEMNVDNTYIDKRRKRSCKACHRESLNKRRQLHGRTN